MSVPGIVQSELDGEQVAAQVPLGGEDALFVTPTRTLIYRADGLLSDESVEEYPHDAERIEVSEGRRKSAVELDYGIEGEARFKVPSGRLYEALHPVLAGVLNAADVTGPDETVKQTYQFSELTLVITSERVVKHVGAAVWDEDHEEYPFEDVTRLDVEEGSVSSQIIIESGGRPQRIKTPSDQTREVRERIERALLAYHDAASYEAFASERADDSGDETGDDREAEAEREQSDADPLAGGVDPIEANPPELDDDGAIVEEDASVTTGEQAGAGAEPDATAGASAEPDATTGASAESDATAGAGGGSIANPGGSGDASAGAGAESNASAGTDPDAGTDRTSPESGENAGETTGDASTGDATTVDADAAGEAQTADATRADAAQTDEREQATGASQATGEPDAPERAGVTDRAETANPARAPDSAGANDGAEATDEPVTTDAAESGSGFADSGFEPASSELEADETAAQLEALTEAVERQNELLAEQQRTLEQLIDELSRGR